MIAINSKTLGLACSLLMAAMIMATPRVAIAISFDKTATEEEQRIMRRILPGAETFSRKAGTPLHYKAFAVDPKTKKQVQVGFVFLTTDVEPDEIAYAGPVRVLVGLTTGGVIRGIRVREHREPFGSFSIDTNEFAEQFEDKKITDPFELGTDIDGVTRATISIEGATRVIRKSARKIMQQYLQEQQSKKK
jgi:NosR/NirI family transcriptional regulator, nitrous oxide reductase regulator